MPVFREIMKRKKMKRKVQQGKKPAMKDEVIPKICHQDENPDNENFCQPLTGSDRSKKLGWLEQSHLHVSHPKADTIKPVSSCPMNPLLCSVFSSRSRPNRP